MSYKEIYDQLTSLCNKYCLISGQADIREIEKGRFEFATIEEHDYLIVAGCFPNDLIQKSFIDFECEVGSSGPYEFRALLSYEPAQIGNYPPPNVEVETHMMIEHIEYKKVIFSDENPSY
jgi:hypothetical protein